MAGLLIRDAKTGRTRALTPFQQLSRASSGAAQNPDVIVGCHTVGASVIVWLGTSFDGIHGVTYVVHGQHLVPVAAGFPVVSTERYVVSADAEAAADDRRPLAYEVQYGA